MSRKLLFISPMMPGLSTGGSSMRAGMILEALTRSFEVYVLLAPLGSRAGYRTLPDQFGHLGSRFLVADDRGRVLSPQFHTDGGVVTDGGATAVNRFVEEALLPWRHIRFDVVHIYRLPLAPFARAFDNTLAARFLDMDDIESTTSARLSQLYLRHDRLSAAQSSLRYAEVHRLREESCLRSFDGVFVCSKDDAFSLQQMYRCQTFVLPNTVAIPPLLRPKTRGRFTILFAGSMDYLPNEDGALQLVDYILPRIVRSYEGPVEVLIVGNRPSPRVLALRSRMSVTVTGAVDSVTPYYRKATVAVAPLRAGGGTRLKILEAAAHRVPVVSTPIGAEGLEVSHGNQLLIAHTLEQFAGQCVRLQLDHGLRSRIVDNAYRWVMREHTASALQQAIAAAHTVAGVSSS